MFLWAIFIVVSFLLGLSISLLLDYRFKSIERVLFSFVVGHALSIWIVFLLSCLIGSLRISGIIFCIGICMVASVIFATIKQKPSLEKNRGFLLALWGSAPQPQKPCKGLVFFCKKKKCDLKNKVRDVWYSEKYTLAFLIFILLYVTAMNLYGVFRPDEAGDLYAFHTVWADYPFHTSIITSFVYKDTFSFPLDNPQFLQVKMHYPFLMDFYSAVLMKGGLDLRSSIIIPNILFQLSFFGLLYFLAFKLTGLKGAGIGATLIFILSGFPAGLQSAGIHFLNPIYAVIMPQRTAIIGMAISFVIYILLYHALCTEKREKTSAVGGPHKELMLAGVLIGLLPYIHAHSFMATGFVALFLASFALLKEREVKFLAFLVLPLLILSLPQVLFIRTGVSQDFFVFFPGWTEENREMIMGFDWSSIPASLSSIARTTFLLEAFWALNAGALIILLSLGFFKTRNETRIFYLPFLLLFFVANVVKFQPWPFDNYKIFIHWLALSTVMASLAIWWIHDSNKKSAKLVTVSLAAVLIACTIFGVGTHAMMLQNTYMVWSGEEIQMAEWVRENTASNSVFLTGSAHNHPISSLTGRQRVMGYEGWLWSHGIDWDSITERQKDVIAMYKGNHTLMHDYGVDYVSVGPYERAFARENHFELNDAAFDDETRFDLNYDAMIAGERWRIYQVKTPNIPA